MHGKIIFHVEGDTEERFVKEVFQSHFQQFDVELIPIKVGKRKEIRGPCDRGGTAEKSLTLGEIKRSLSRKDVVLVTTMLDYFKLHESYGKSEAEGNNAAEKAQNIELNLHKDVDESRKFVPYIQIHDFEAILFSSPDIIARNLGETHKVKDHLWKIKQNFPNPENIDDDECPAYRLEKICINELGMGRYPKKMLGSRIAKEIGLKVIREQCRHFNQWLTELENRVKQSTQTSSP